MTRTPSPAAFAAGLLALLVAIAAAGCGDSGGSTPTTPTTPTPTVTLPPMSVMLAEKALGSATAPVTMIAYSSLSCSHCGDFHTSTLPALKSAYVDTGRMRFVFRDYSRSDADTAGSMVARCSGDNYFATLDALFKAQSSWAYASNYTASLKTVVAPLGITSATVDACLASTELRNGVLAIKQAGLSTYSISGTPTFIINGQTVLGAYPYAYFASIIDSF
jgi:protein-disulfide isomerase